MKPSNVSARSLFDVQGLTPPKLGRSIDLLSTIHLLMPTSARREWNNVLEAIKQETHVTSDCHLLLCLVFALTQSHNFNTIHLLRNSSENPTKTQELDSISYLNAAKTFIVSNQCVLK